MAPLRRQAYALLRLTVGVDMLIHGLTRIGSGADAFAETIVKEFNTTILPATLVHGFAFLLPFVEALLGALLVLGFLTREALILGSTLMITLIFGTGLRSEWNTVGLQLFYGFVYYVLLVKLGDNAYAIDTLRSRRAAEDAPH